VAAITYLVQVSAHLIEDINRGKQIPGLKFALDLDGVLFILKQNLHVGDSSVPGARTRPHLDCPWGHAQEYWAMTRRSYGFHTPEAALALIMLACGPVEIKLPYQK